MSPRKNLKPGQEQSNKHAGSLRPGEPVFLEVGRLRRSHGIAGEIILEVLSDSTEYFDEGKTLLIGKSKVPRVIESVRDHNKLLLVRFAGLNTPEEVSEFTNQLAYVPLDALKPLPKGQFYFFQLIGLTAYDPQGNLLGVLTEIIQTGAVPVYVVTADDGSEHLMPAIPEVVVKVDLEGRKIILKPQEWE